MGSGLVQPRMRDYDVKHGYVNLYEIAKKKLQEEEEEGQTEISPVASNPIQNNMLLHMNKRQNFSESNINHLINQFVIV